MHAMVVVDDLSSGLWNVETDLHAVFRRPGSVEHKETKKPATVSTTVAIKSPLRCKRCTDVATQLVHWTSTRPGRYVLRVQRAMARK